jgi:hypothetical protein
MRPLVPSAAVTEQAVRVDDRAGERALATGAIAADSLALASSTLYWAADGVPQAGVLR